MRRRLEDSAAAGSRGGASVSSPGWDSLPDSWDVTGRKSTRLDEVSGCP